MIKLGGTRRIVSPATRLTSTALLAALLATAAFLSPRSASAQTRDHLTGQEGELVRFNQELDKRTDVFIRAINLRFAIINGTAAPPKPKKTNKEEPDWGDPPKGSRAELLEDIAGILDEAITNIDDVSRELGDQWLSYPTQHAPESDQGPRRTGGDRAHPGLRQSNHRSWKQTAPTGAGVRQEEKETLR